MQRVDTLDDENELYVFRANLVAQEAIHVERVMNVGSMDAGKNVELDAMAFQ
jgi:hypothetical protein